MKRGARARRGACNCAPLLLAAAVQASAWAQAPETRPAGVQQDVVFGEYSPLATSSELIRRLADPLAAAEIHKTLQRSGKKLIEQSLDLSAERFVVYVPRNRPPLGYALLVFVAPWDDALLPPGWDAVLDQYGVVFVSAARSGNDAEALTRREPLALHAAYNIMQRYPIDAQRVYVGGFSGGSRTALHLALGYPDLFRGALLNAGSDPLGTAITPLPPRELWRRFQEAMRLVYVTGEHDGRIEWDAESLHSLRRWCVFDAEGEVVTGAGHELTRPTALARALRALDKHTPPDPGKLAACRDGLDHEVTAQLTHVQQLIDSGQRAAAQKLLTETSQRFGGLAAPRALELQALLE